MNEAGADGLKAETRPRPPHQFAGQKFIFIYILSKEINE